MLFPTGPQIGTSATRTLPSQREAFLGPNSHVTEAAGQGPSAARRATAGSEFTLEEQLMLALVRAAWQFGIA